MHVNGATILAAADGAQLDADDNGVAGGELTFKFSTVSLTPLVGTSLSGKVVEAGPDLKPMTYDDIRVGPDQVMHTPDDLFLTPLAGVKVFIVGLESQFVLTDAQGNFSFPSVPAGNVKLAIDGRTATNAPAGTFFPEMVMDLSLEAGRANTVMGTMGTLEQQAANRDRQEVYLPRLQTSILQNVSGATPTTITTSDAAAPTSRRNSARSSPYKFSPAACAIKTATRLRRAKSASARSPRRSCAKCYRQDFCSTRSTSPSNRPA